MLREIPHSVSVKTHKRNWNVLAEPAKELQYPSAIPISVFHQQGHQFSNIYILYQPLDFLFLFLCHEKPPFVNCSTFLTKLQFFCSKRIDLSKILKLSFVKVTICKQILRISVFDEPYILIFRFCVVTRTPFLPFSWVATPNIPVPHDGCVRILAMQLYKQRP